MNKNKKFTFLICPVRGHKRSETEAIVKCLEDKGFQVHWPPRDTDQDDPTGYRICRDNVIAIQKSDVVHFVWDGDSQGCLFDLGAAFALGKKIVPISMPETTDGKSFQNMVNEWAHRDECRICEGAGAILGDGFPPEPIRCGACRGTGKR